MKISTFTPIHKYRYDYIHKLYHSCLDADEMIFLLNGEAINHKDEIVRNFPKASVYTTDITNNIGELKRKCCDLSTSDVFVEVDYDDYLVNDAITKIREAFYDESVMFVYSNVARRKESGEWDKYNIACGWKFREKSEYTEIISFPPLPQYLRRIEWAPDHVRCFRREGYYSVGGHDTTLQLGDDHDLVCKLYTQYGEKGFKHIDEVLYIYNIHSSNTSFDLVRNAEIQEQVDRNYIKHAEAMYKKWAVDNSLKCIDLGGRFNSPDGYITVDLHDADIIADLNNEWPFADNSVGIIRAYHILEHLKDPIHFFNNAYRVLAPGGFLLIEVPSTKGDGAFSDPTHIKFFNLLSFEYYTNKNFSRFIEPMYKGKFQTARLVEYWWDSPNIPIISGQFICLKGWYDENWCGFRNM